MSKEQVSEVKTPVVENPQREHYVELHDEYSAHYYDDTSIAYRKEFIYDPLFADVNLNGLEVAELASGGGANSRELLKYFPDAKVTGFDISPSACEEFERIVGRPAIEVDLTKPYAEMDGHFDAALIIGGLHHCVADLDTTLSNVARMLKPGGVLLMCEPNDGFVLERIRGLWYGQDKYFDADSEHALDHAELLKSVSGEFSLNSLSYIGGPAYFLILNSLILRVPLTWKPKLAPVLTRIERLYHHLPGKFLFPAFLASWRRT